MASNNALPKKITANNDLELAILRAMFALASANWYGNFPADVEYQLYKITGVDTGKQINLDMLSDLMVSWERSLK